MMENLATGAPAWLSPALRVVILVPAGLLVFYHLIMIYDILGGRGLSTDSGYNAIHFVLRLAIATSLTCVVLGVRGAIWTMWASIASLIATQYYAHFGYVQADFVAGRHPLSYLKGFIFPSIITTAFFLREKLAA